MNSKEQNEIRLVASAAVHQLYEAKAVSQLNLLKMQIERSLEEIDAAKPAPKTEQEGAE